VCSEEERRWLEEAAGRHMAEDVVSRLREIALLMSTPLSVLEAQGITPEDIEGTGSTIRHLACQPKVVAEVDLY
jgi:hsp70-interacting protein